MRDYKIVKLDDWNLDSEHFWPVVYVLKEKGGNDLYIGETNNIKKRIADHKKSKNKTNLNDGIIIEHSESNKSLAVFLETYLIRNSFADETVNTLNIKKQISTMNKINFFDKRKIEEEAPSIWDKLVENGLFSSKDKEIRVKDLFINSPLTDFTKEQEHVIDRVMNNIVKENNTLITGGPGAGKTVMIFHIILKFFLLNPDSQIKIGIYSAKRNNNILISSLLKKISPIVNNRIKLIDKLNEDNLFKVDHIIIDEAHRIRKTDNTYGLTNLLKKEGHKYNDEFDYIRQAYGVSGITIFYDEWQRAGWNDSMFVDKNDYDEIFNLKEQFRINGCKNYIQFLYDVLMLEKDSGEGFDFSEFEFNIFDTKSEGLKWIDQKSRESNSARNALSYSGMEEWKQVKGPKRFSTVKIGENIFQYNDSRKSEDWVNLSTTMGDIATIDNIQGKTIEYEMLWIGSGVDYDFDKNKIIFNFKKYPENKIRVGANVTEDESTNYRKVICLSELYVLMSRSTKGLGIYCENKNLRKYLSEFKVKRVIK